VVLVGKEYIGADIASHHHRHIAGADVLLAHEHHVGGFHHCVSGLDRSDEAPGLD